MSETSLSTLLHGLAPVTPAEERTIIGLASDSRLARPGDLFLALRGLHHHGLEFLPELHRAGVAAVAWEPPYDGALPAADGLPLIPVAELSRRLGVIAERFHGFPSRDMTLIGVTGTDGKTSCSQFIAQALGLLGMPCGVLGTIGYGLPGHLMPASHTTPDALTLWERLAALREQGVRRLAMEVSSHALEQGRVMGLRFEVAVLTNLTRDHLDYHGSLEAYAAAKRKLFTDYDIRCAVLNLDDAFGRRLAAELVDSVAVIGYGLGRAPADWHGPWLGCRELHALAGGLELAIDTSHWGEARVSSPLLGRFNGANLLAVLGVLLALQVPFGDAVTALERLSTVPGRMERFGGGRGRPLAVVDYAHTPNALEQVLAALREHIHDGRLWCVFGCGGDRDPGKRPQMGAVAERLADRVIVTNDNPRSEAPEAIAEQILAGMRAPERARIILDRGAAIQYALRKAAPGDIVLIAGKGHEDYQLIGGRRLDFSDRIVVRQWLGTAA
ncbi:MAG TPA: UDP-N-acetylmuramoyl-L-alanyl-D-glutamate--2,6-diaminopimelate ligase [Candidatus Competibacteraceae bacterium]|nr:UDP-N-acetylmuramoyl-L-alanyl-D-glutamate--2,6-diaminopimelate ligase [Candidatus Competibacteraceae bacterium]